MKCIPGPCDVKMDRNKKKHILEKNTSDLLCDSVRHSYLEIRN